MKSKIHWQSEYLTLAQRYGTRVAVSDVERSLTYAELFSAAAGIARYMHEFGISPGTPVATYLPNSCAAVYTSYGVTLSGAAEVSLNSRLSFTEVQHCLLTSSAQILLTDRHRAAALAPVLKELSKLSIVTIEDIPSADLASLQLPAVNDDTWVKIIFTSGTTGRPKGIVYSHAGRWIANILLRSHLPIVPGADSDLLLPTPFSHGASLMTYAYLDSGARVTLLDGVDVADIEQRLRSGRNNQLFAPPTVLAKLMSKLEGTRIEGVRTIFCGTAPLSRELYRRVRSVFGPVVRITYGKSETFNPITILTPEETDDWYENCQPERSVCVGWPASGVELWIARSSDDALIADFPDAGPIMLRARHQLIGTLIDGVFEAHPADQPHRTGDIGFFDQRGRLHLIGREADIIKSGGYRISPDEVEGILRAAMPFADFTIVGLPSEYWGEVVTAVAAGLEEGWESPLSSVIATMTPYKRPRLFARLDVLPRNAMGKVVRASVRSAVLERYELIDGPYPSLQPLCK